jgi:hypothetical protein
MPITIYNVLKESGVKFEKKDSVNIGLLVREHFGTDVPIKKETVEEIYGKQVKKMYVRHYPDECRTEIEEIVVKYFSQKVI